MSGNHLAVFTNEAVKLFGHGASEEFFRRLQEDRQFCATRCTTCGSVAFPPRHHCPDCQEAKVEWVEVGDGATLFAFTSQKRGLRFAAPEVIGVADLPGVGLVMGPIKGSLDELEIGMPLDVEIIDLDEGMSFHRFVPRAS